MGKLSDMVNIGAELQIKLEAAGIKTPEQLQEIGSCNAFQRIYAYDPTICINMLYALEGAVRDLRWHSLSPEMKDELKHFYNTLKK
jgi:DNA transformation protein